MRGAQFITAFISSFVVTSKERRDERGASFTEYVVLLALVVGIVAAVLGTGLQGALSNAITAITAKIPGGAAA